MTTEEKMAIMKAYIEGNRVQCKALKYDVCIWMDDSNPCWDWNNYEYRVKPEATEPSYSIDDVIKRITERCEETAWLPFDSSVVEYLKSVKTLTEKNENLKNEVNELKNSCSYQVYGDMLKEKEKYENKISNINTENEELKAKIKSLRAERHEMASAVSNAVWKELMVRAKNIEGPVNTSIVGFGFNDISDVVLNKIIDYKPEDKPVKKVRRMTGIELAEWCAKGKGLFKNTEKNMTYTYVSFDSDEQLDKPVGEWILIRGWDDPDWREPMIADNEYNSNDTCNVTVPPDDGEFTMWSLGYCSHRSVLVKLLVPANAKRIYMGADAWWSIRVSEAVVKGYFSTKRLDVPEEISVEEIPHSSGIVKGVFKYPMNEIVKPYYEFKEDGKMQDGACIPGWIRFEDAMWFARL